MYCKQQQNNGNVTVVQGQDVLGRLGLPQRPPARAQSEVSLFPLCYLRIKVCVFFKGGAYIDHRAPKARKVRQSFGCIPRKTRYGSDPQEKSSPDPTIV